MKKVKLKEEAYRNLLNEIGYGNDDLGNLYEDMKQAFTDFTNILSEHVIMTRNMNQDINPYIKGISEHAVEIEKLINQFGNALNHESDL
jgi:hypothetical protein